MSVGQFFNPKVLTTKVGPLPVWAYAVTIGGVYYVFSRRNGGNNKGVQAPTVTADSSGYYGGYRPAMPVTGAGGSTQPQGFSSLTSPTPGPGIVHLDPAQQPITSKPTAPVQASAPAPTGAPASVVGVLPAGANYGYSDFPTTTVAGSVQAPSGGSFMYGQWNGDQLVSATYQMPDGTFKSV